MNNRNKRESNVMATKIAALIVNVNFDGDKAIYESCTANSFSKNHIKLNLIQCSDLNSVSDIYSAFEKNGALPPITVEGFYMPNYGAGFYVPNHVPRAGQEIFDPNKNYIGFVIMAVHANGQWYTDHSKTFT